MTMNFCGIMPLHSLLSSTLALDIIGIKCTSSDENSNYAINLTRFNNKSDSLW